MRTFKVLTGGAIAFVLTTVVLAGPTEESAINCSPFSDRLHPLATTPLGDLLLPSLDGISVEPLDRSISALNDVTRRTLTAGATPFAEGTRMLDSARISPAAGSTSAIASVPIPSAFAAGTAGLLGLGILRKVRSR